MTARPASAGTVWRHWSSESSVGTSKIVGANSGGSVSASSVRAWAAWVARFRARVLRSSQPSAAASASTNASTRAAASIGVRLVEAEEVPARLVVGGLAIGEVDLHDPVADAWIGEVGLDLGDRVGMGIEEQAAVPDARPARRTDRSPSRSCRTATDPPCRQKNVSASAAPRPSAARCASHPAQRDDTGLAGVFGQPARRRRDRAARRARRSRHGNGRSVA